MMLRTAALLALVASAAAAAQTPRLVIREAVILNGLERPDAVPDTAAMEQASLPGMEGGTVYLGRTLLDLGPGTLLSATVGSEAYTGAPEVALKMAGPAAAAFATLTSERVGEPVALVLDGRVLTAPTIHGKIPNGLVQITGQFTRAEADALAAALREATGATGTERLPADFSTPEGAVAAFLAAIDAEDWGALADAFHPDARAFIREDMTGALIIARDSVLLGDGYDPTGYAVSISDVLGIGIRERDPARLSDTDFAALALALTHGRVYTRGVGGFFDILGSVPEGLETAHVVLRRHATASAAAGLSETAVQTVYKDGDSWRVFVTLP